MDNFVWPDKRVMTKLIWDFIDLLSWTFFLERGTIFSQTAWFDSLHLESQKTANIQDIVYDI